MATRLHDKRGIPLQSTINSHPAGLLRPRTRVVVLPVRRITARQTRRVCDHCGGNNPYSCPNLRDEVWLTIAHKRQVLCFECAETLLARPITIADLNYAPVNYGFRKLWERAHGH